MLRKQISPQWNQENLPSFLNQMRAGDHVSFHTDTSDLTEGSCKLHADRLVVTTQWMLSHTYVGSKYLLFAIRYYASLHISLNNNITSHGDYHLSL